MAATHTEPARRDELVNLSGLIALGTLMDGVDDECEIGRMALDAVPSLGAVDAVGIELDDVGWISAEGGSRDRPPPDGVERVFPLPTFRGRIGRLRVGDRPGGPVVPDFPLEILARETARAISAARVRAKLGQSERRYRQLVESSRDVVFALDASGIVRFVSGRVRAATGYEPSELVGLDLLDLAPRGQRASAAEWFARMLATRDGDSLELSVTRRDGAISEVVVQGVPAFDEDGRVTAVVGTLADVTDERRKERERFEMAEQLRHAQRLDSLGKLTAGIAHDFNNLLTTIYGSSDLALSLMTDNPAATVELEEIRRAATRAGDLTKQLLAFGRRRLLREQELALDDVVRSAEPLVRRVIGDPVVVELDLGAAGERCFADPQALEQVIVNLGLNAQEAMPSGGTLRLTTRAETFADGDAPRGLAAGRYVRLDVSDTGVGMDPATLERAFEPFFTTKSFGSAPGLGLSTAWGIVGQSGGTITVTSAPGAGSTFRVYLPAVSA